MNRVQAFATLQIALSGLAIGHDIIEHRITQDVINHKINSNIIGLHTLFYATNIGSEDFLRLYFKCHSLIETYISRYGTDTITYADEHAALQKFLETDDAYPLIQEAIDFMQGDMGVTFKSSNVK